MHSIGIRGISPHFPIRNLNQENPLIHLIKCNQTNWENCNIENSFECLNAGMAKRHCWSIQHRLWKMISSRKLISLLFSGFQICITFWHKMSWTQSINLWNSIGEKPRKRDSGIMFFFIQCFSRKPYFTEKLFILLSLRRRKEFSSRFRDTFSRIFQTMHDACNRVFRSSIKVHCCLIRLMNK